MKKILPLVITIILIMQALIETPQGLFNMNMYGTYWGFFDSALFLVLGLLNIKFHGNRIFQWVVIVTSCLWFMGGILGLGWITALIMGILYILSGKKDKEIAS